MAVFLWILVGLVALGLLARGLSNVLAHGLARWVGAAALSAQPDTIRLVACDPDAWVDAGAAHALAGEFVGLGFEDAGSHRVEEMPGVRVRLLAHSGHRLYAAIYEHPDAGSWFDVVAPADDGTGATFTTAPPTGLDPRPGHPVIHAPATSPRALVERAQWERAGFAPAAVSAAGVVGVFEAAYAESMAWRKGRGISVLEVERAAVREAA